MSEPSNDLRKTLTSDSLNRNNDRRSDSLRETFTNYENDAIECDREAWETLSGGIDRVQSVLDQNRALIQQVNENHQSKIPENLVKNVALIREINGNIAKVLSLYSDLSINFTDLVQHRKGSSPKISDGNSKSGGAKGGNDVVDAAAMQ